MFLVIWHSYAQKILHITIEVHVVQIEIGYVLFRFVVAIWENMSRFIHVRLYLCGLGTPNFVRELDQ